MAEVVRLVTVVDVDAEPSRDAASFTAVHVAVLDDGRRVPLLADRGWTVSGPADIWRHMTAAEVAATARAVVGPDEPHGDTSTEDMARDHWQHLAGVLRRHDVRVAAEVLRRLPHDVEIGARLRARL